MIALTTIWRWRKDGTLETTQPGERCDWVTVDSPYYQLGMVRPA